MSFLSVTLVSAALLGLAPDGANSETPVTESATSAERSVLLVSNDQVEWTEGGPPVEASGGQTASDTQWVTEQAGSQSHCVPTGCETSAGCETQYGTYSGGYCENGGGGWCPWGDDDDCEPNCWDRKLINYCIGPGDFHPHYPYPPVYHGYYYFRPYNFEHVLRDAATAAQMGGDPRAPYSVEFLKVYFPPTPIEEIPVSGMEAQLPLLEDLLKPEPPAIPDAPALPVNPDKIPAPAPGVDDPINPADIPMPDLGKGL